MIIIYYFKSPNKTVGSLVLDKRNIDKIETFTNTTNQKHISVNNGMAHVYTKTNNSSQLDAKLNKIQTLIQCIDKNGTVFDRSSYTIENPVIWPTHQLIYP